MMDLEFLLLKLKNHRVVALDSFCARSKLERETNPSVKLCDSYNDLCNYLSSGPIVVMILEKENAVLENRELMGATNPKDAEEGTIRKKYGISIDKNSVHGSDSIENAKIEIDFFFKD